MLTVFGKLSMLDKEMEQLKALRDQARMCGDVHMAEDYDGLYFAKLLEFNTIIDEMKVVEQPTQFEQVLQEALNTKDRRIAELEGDLNQKYEDEACDGVEIKSED